MNTTPEESNRISPFLAALCIMIVLITVTGQFLLARTALGYEIPFTKKSDDRSVQRVIHYRYETLYFYRDGKLVYACPYSSIYSDGMSKRTKKIAERIGYDVIYHN